MHARPPTRLPLLLCVTLGLTACAAPKYADVVLPTPARPAGVATLSPRAIVVFEPAVPGRSLLETVWDNVDGPQWNPAESTKIGFTQHYSLPAAAFVPQPVRVGLFASGQASFVSSRIMMPFGRLIATACEQQLKARFAQVAVCFDAPCVAQAQGQGTPATLLRVAITQAAVAETRTNRVSLATKGTVSV
ncbi:MAG: hypothetical protein CFE45_18285, partial [Burkholderiales bacterium PBB5]